MARSQHVSVPRPRRRHPERAAPAQVVCGLDELASHSRWDPTHVLSILDPEQSEPPGLALCRPGRLLRLHFHDAIEPLPGMKLPTAGDIGRILEFGAGLGSDARLLVHCHFGISRSAAALAMLIARDNLLAGDEVFRRLIEVRPRVWPNSLMLRHADALLGRGGELMQALGRLYHSQSKRVPDIAQFMRVHRSSETDMADAAAGTGGTEP
jgi:predicted protein tyrosine phosphatase